jgi:ubiquinone/menaquinone biosynthesis C-methylase UbiE
MEVQKAYDEWAHQYDDNKNRTRDLEAISLRATLHGMTFDHCLEIGCGTGKNTEWLQTVCNRVLAVDLSGEMLAKAKTKIQVDNVRFLQADITKDWDFAGEAHFDLLTFSLVLEHIEDLDLVFQKAKQVVADNGYVYIGELHPFKQYGGTKARFETESGVQVVTCFNHHVSDFTMAAKRSGFQVIEINEYFDENDRSGVPRILTLLLRKQP